MDVVATFDQKADDRDGVGNVEKDNAGRDHAVECRIATQIQQSQDRHNDAADKMRSQGNVHARVYVAEKLRKGKSTVASKRPAEPTLPCMAGDQTPDPCRYDQTLKHNGSSFAPEGLVEQRQNRYKGGGGLKIRKAVHAEEEADGEKPRGDESNGDGAQDGDGNHFLRTMNFLGKVSGTIEASKGVVGVDQSDNESDPVGGPSSIVHKVGKDKLGILMRWRLCRYRD